MVKFITVSPHMSRLFSWLRDRNHFQGTVKRSLILRNLKKKLDFVQIMTYNADLKRIWLLLNDNCQQDANDSNETFITWAMFFLNLFSTYSIDGDGLKMKLEYIKHYITSVCMKWFVTPYIFIIEGGSLNFCSGLS